MLDLETNGTIDPEEAIRRAAELALGATDYGLVLGMPGTGKTSTVEFVVRCFVAAGLRVLVASYSHAAVDHLLEKLLDSGVSERCVARVAELLLRNGYRLQSSAHDHIWLRSNFQPAITRHGGKVTDRTSSAFEYSCG
mgnify:CR=1 FL=1